MSDFYMCSNCDTQHQTAEEAMECCMCESCAAKDKCIKELTEENELLAKRIDDQKEGLAKYEAQLDALQQQVCDECDPDDYGWKYNAVEGRHPCTCIVESGAYQELKQQLDAVRKAFNIPDWQDCVNEGGPGG